MRSPHSPLGSDCDIQRRISTIVETSEYLNKKHDLEVVVAIIDQKTGRSAFPGFLYESSGAENFLRTIGKGDSQDAFLEQFMGHVRDATASQVILDEEDGEDENAPDEAVKNLTSADLQKLSNPDLSSRLKSRILMCAKNAGLRLPENLGWGVLIRTLTEAQFSMQNVPNLGNQSNFENFKGNESTHHLTRDFKLRLFRQLEHQTHPLSFKKEQQSDILSNKVPVIMYAPKQGSNSTKDVKYIFHDSTVGNGPPAPPQVQKQPLEFSKNASASHSSRTRAKPSNSKGKRKRELDVSSSDEEERPRASGHWKQRTRRDGDLDFDHQVPHLITPGAASYDMNNYILQNAFLPEAGYNPYRGHPYASGAPIQMISTPMHQPYIGLSVVQPGQMAPVPHVAAGSGVQYFRKRPKY